MMSKEEQQLMEACLDNSSEPTVVLKLRDNLPMWILDRYDKNRTLAMQLDMCNINIAGFGNARSGFRTNLKCRSISRLLGKLKVLPLFKHTCTDNLATE